MKQSEYEKWIEAIVSDFEQKFIESTGLTKAEFPAYCNDNIFFITMHIDRSCIVGGSPGQSDVERAMAIFKRWYFRLAKLSLGNRLGQKLTIQPRGIAFADFNGSRASNGGLNSLRSGPAHIHAVLMVMPDKGQAFKELLLSAGALSTSEIPNIEIKPFCVQPKYVGTNTAFHNSLSNLISYCAKGYRSLPDSYASKEDSCLFLPA